MPPLPGVTADAGGPGLLSRSDVGPGRIAASLPGRVGGGASAAAPGGVEPSLQRDFADLLGIARRVRGGGGADLERRAHDTAERFVATTFVQPLLDRFTEMSDPAPPFQRTRAERTFGTLLNGQMALEVVRKGEWSVVDRVASRLLEQAGGGPGSPGRAGVTPGEVSR